VAAREASLAAERDALDRAREELAEALAATAAGLGLRDPAAVRAPTHAHVRFVPAGGVYRLVEADGPPPEPGAAVDVDGVPHVVERVGPSPLPGDERRCGYLVPLSAPAE
jgi:hypothetical protein